MNAEEPIQSIGANQIVSTQGDPLQEQPRIPTTSMPRQLSFSSLIYQWQPMGLRVVVNLPFVGDDKDFLFYIRNGPFVPYLREYRDDSISQEPGVSLYPDGVGSYGLNNMAAVFLFSDAFREYPDYSGTKNFPVTLTQYDTPPIIASMAQAFRRWRGSMQYRIRVVAGSITQGYIIVTPLKNVFVPIAIYNQFKYQPAIQRQDYSYKASMLNSYGLVDIAMIRHSEITMPFDYPVAYYDQFAWMSRRTCPSQDWAGISDKSKFKPVPVGPTLKSEPHGDNFIAVGLRGALSASAVGSQLEFELEYRCMEGFQFADPYLPPRRMCRDTRSLLKAGLLPYRIPSRDWESDGIGMPTRVKKQSRLTEVITGTAGINLGKSSRAHYG